MIVIFSIIYHHDDNDDDNDVSSFICAFDLSIYKTCGFCNWNFHIKTLFLWIKIFIYLHYWLHFPLLLLHQFTPHVSPLSYLHPLLPCFCLERCRLLKVVNKTWHITLRYDQTISFVLRLGEANQYEEWVSKTPIQLFWIGFDCTASGPTIRLKYTTVTICTRPRPIPCMLTSCCSRVCQLLWGQISCFYMFSCDDIKPLALKVLPSSAPWDS